MQKTTSPRILTSLDFSCLSYPLTNYVRSVLQTEFARQSVQRAPCFSTLTPAASAANKQIPISSVGNQSRVESFILI